MSTYLIVTAKEKSGKEHTWVATPSLTLVKKDKSPEEIERSAVDKGYEVFYCEIYTLGITKRQSDQIVNAVLEELGAQQWEVQIDVTHRIVVPDAGP